MVSSEFNIYVPDWLIQFEKEVASDIILSNVPGTVINKYRMRYGMTQIQLGQFLDMRRESISRIENGSVTPTIEFIQSFIKIAAFIEAVRVQRAERKEIDIPLFERIGKELGLPDAKFDTLVNIALKNYNKKIEKIQKSLKN